MPLKPLPPFHAKCSLPVNHKRINIAEGSVRSGKTVTMNIAWLNLLLTLKHLDGDLLMLGKTERTLKRNVINPIQKIVGRSRCKLNSGTGEAKIFGHTIYVAGANDERAHEKIAGLTVQAALADEISLYPESMWKMLTSRLSLDNSILLGTTNPGAPTHYLKTGYLDKAEVHYTSSGTKRSKLEKPLDVARMTFQLTDNPYLPDSYIEELYREYTGLWFRRYVLGEWVLADGAIYESYDPARHVKTITRIPGNTCVVGIDYGTTNPFSAHAIEFRSDGLHVFAEYYEKRPLTDEQLIKNLQKWLRDNSINARWFCVDPSAASFLMAMHNAGFSNIMKANNDVLFGLRLVASLFSQGLITINPICENLQKELPGYSWDPKASERGEDKPIKENDHACDDLRYGIASTEHMWRNILRLQVAA